MRARTSQSAGNANKSKNTLITLLGHQQKCRLSAQNKHQNPGLVAYRLKRLSSKQEISGSNPAKTYLCSEKLLSTQGNDAKNDERLEKLSPSSWKQQPSPS